MLFQNSTLLQLGRVIYKALMEEYQTGLVSLNIRVLDRYTDLSICPVTGRLHVKHIILLTACFCRS